MKRECVLIIVIVFCAILLGCSQPQDAKISEQAINPSIAVQPSQNLMASPSLKISLVPTFTPSPVPNEIIIVEKQKIEVLYNERNYIGEYSGEMQDALPNGTGKFTSVNETDYLQYTGKWEKGSFAGTGYLKTNSYFMPIYEKYRIGTYEGTVEDGIANGEGTFSAVNDSDMAYTYVGEWENGQFNGQGELSFDGGIIQSGNFIDGEFYPTPIEFFNYAGQPSEGWYGFTIQEKSQAFLMEHSELFTRNSEEGLGAFVDTKFMYKAYAKSPDAYGDRIIRQAKMNVVQITEEDVVGNYRLTTIIALDTSENIYYIYYLGTVEDVYDNDEITMYALPLDYFIYESNARQDIPAIVCAAIYIKG